MQKLQLTRLAQASCRLPTKAFIPRRSLLQLQPTTVRPFSSSHRVQNLYEEAPRPSFYKTHGRAFFKCFTLAFFTYQVLYYCWLTLETEYLKDEKDREIKSLESELRLLDEGRKSHRTSDGG